VGLVVYANRNRTGESGRPLGAGALSRFTGRLRVLFKEFLGIGV
jgi:hypothetical protein